MKVFIVMTDDCNENDCGCYIESVDSVHATEKSAILRCSQVYRGRIQCEYVHGLAE